MKSEEIFLQENTFRQIETVHKGESPWSVIAQIPSMIETNIQKSTPSPESEINVFGLLQKVTDAKGAVIEISLLIKKTVILEKEINVGSHILIGASTYLEAGAIIKAPCVIGEGSEIRQGAYLRGNVIVGNQSVIGHVTEVKNSIIMDNSAAGHFAYIGDSVLGSHVNLGAGTKLANLQFRTRDEIDSNQIKEIVIKSKGAVIATGMQKLGAVIGDYTEIGCNTVSSPGTIIGHNCWVAPNTTLHKGYYSSQSFLRNKSGSKVEKSQI